MLEQVELKIQELKKLRAEEYYKKKDEDLKAWGLTTKVDGKKVTPIIVTDEEYEELVKASNGVGKTGRNAVANLLNILSLVIVVLGVVAGVVAGDLSEGSTVISFTLTVVIACIIAVLFRGVSEAIRLLQQLIDGRTLERPDPSAMKKPRLKRQVQSSPLRLLCTLHIPHRDRATLTPTPFMQLRAIFPLRPPQCPAILLKTFRLIISLSRLRLPLHLLLPKQ